MRFKRVRLFLALCLMWTASIQTRSQPNDEAIIIEGFTRLFEDAIFLKQARITLEEYQWDDQANAAPILVATQTLETSDHGRFIARATQGRWFRLRLHSGSPPSYEVARDAWLQHIAVLNSLLEFDAIKTFFELLLGKKVSEWINEGLLDYIEMDSNFLPANRHYVTRNNEISFQVPLRITYKLLEQLGSSVYDNEPDPNSCHVAVTALAPKRSRHRPPPVSLPRRSSSFPCYYQNATFPAVETLEDCPHGASKVTFFSSPRSRFTHYLGINDNCKTDLLSTGLSNTTRDGGAILFNIRAQKNVGELKAYQHDSLHIGTHYFLCEPGRIINISPPQGPVGINDESDWTAKKTVPSVSVVSGLLNFACYLFPEITLAPETIITTIQSIIMLRIIHRLINLLSEQSIRSSVW